LSITLVRLEERYGTLEKKMKKNPPLLSIMFINSFDESCDTFGEGKKNPHCHQ
jgi:hypothetical protein